MSDLEQKILKSHPPEAFLEEKFHSLGFEQLTDIQKRALPIIHQKIDSLVIAPTGSGKTECVSNSYLFTGKGNKKAGKDQGALHYTVKST